MRDKEIVREIDLYLKGEMTIKEADQLWGKLLENPEYMKLLETEANVRKYFLAENYNHNVTGETGSGPVHKSGTKLSFKNWIYAVAAVLVIFVMYQLISLDTRTGLQSELLSSIAPQEMVTMDIYRTTDQGYETLDIEINSGYEAAVSGRVDESYAYFISVLEKNPADLQKTVAHLNLGILHYNNADFEEAIQAFRMVTDEENLSVYTLEKGWWYLGNSLAQIGQVSEAHQSIREAYLLDGIFRNDAERLLARIDEHLDN